MKYKKGDIVQIRPDLLTGKVYYNENSPTGDVLTNDMRKNLGKEAEVVGYNQGKYVLNIEGKIRAWELYTDEMLRYPVDELAMSDYTFNLEVERLIVHMESIHLQKLIDEAIDNNDRSEFVRLSEEYRKKRELLEEII